MWFDEGEWQEVYMKFSMFIHPPRPAPRRMTLFPFPSTTFSPATFRKPFDILIYSVVTWML